MPLLSLVLSPKYYFGLVLKKPWEKFMNNIYTTLKCLILLLLFLLINIQINAGTTGKLKGKITDTETGEPILGANVVVEGTYLGAAANEEG